MQVLIVKKNDIEFEELCPIYDLLKEYNIGITKDIKKASFIISFGGDGTILSLVPLLKIKNIPVFSINYGNLGYITKVSKENATKALKKYLNGQYMIDHRNFLRVKLRNKYYYALNEISILKSSINNSMIYIKAYEEKKLINIYRADGLIVSSPTGSTAYSLSAGGPIIHPNLKLICIVPLAPQSLSARSLILKGDLKYIFVANPKSKYAVLNIDGNKHIKIGSNDLIEVKLVDFGIDLIYVDDINYYEVLKNKLHWT